MELKIERSLVNFSFLHEHGCNCTFVKLFLFSLFLFSLRTAGLGGVNKDPMTEAVSTSETFDFYQTARRNISHCIYFAVSPVRWNFWMDGVQFPFIATSGTQPPTYPMVNGSSLKRVKRQEHETLHSTEPEVSMHKC